MNEPTSGATTTGLRSAGGMIREARKAQGVHIGALAAAIKVSQQKLELLEADRFDELPDATFVRALAQTVCRSLKIDPQPVLAQLPLAGGHRLDHISEGINTPFRDRPGRHEPGDYWVLLTRPAVWAPAAVLLAALALFLTPAGVLSGWTQGLRDAMRTAAPAGAEPPVAGALPSSPAPAASSPTLGAGGAAGGSNAANSAASADVMPVVETVHSAPPPVAMPGSADAAADTAAAAAAATTLQLRANAESWVEVVDARSRTLVSRMLQPGETLALEGALPLRLKVGNAAGTEAVFRGRVLDLTAGTRDNVARLELK